MNENIFVRFYRDEFELLANNHKIWYLNGIINEETSAILSSEINNLSIHKVIKENINKLEKDIDMEQIMPFYSMDFQYSLHNRHLMFIGLSIECYLKAFLLISSKASSSTLNSELSGYFISHNLDILFKHSFGENETYNSNKKLLGLLTRAIKSGKYCIEKKDYEEEYNSNYKQKVKGGLLLANYIKEKYTELL